MLNPRKNALSEKKKYRTEPPPRGLEKSSSLRETKKGRGASVSGGFSTTETLRKILGNDLIESIGEFVRNGQTS